MPGALGGRLCCGSVSGVEWPSIHTWRVRGLGHFLPPSRGVGSEGVNERPENEEPQAMCHMFVLFLAGGFPTLVLVSGGSSGVGDRHRSHVTRLPFFFVGPHIGWCYPPLGWCPPLVGLE